MIRVFQDKKTKSITLVDSRGNRLYLSDGFDYLGYTKGSPYLKQDGTVETAEVLKSFDYYVELVPEVR